MTECIKRLIPLIKEESGEKHDERPAALCEVRTWKNRVWCVKSQHLKKLNPECSPDSTASFRSTYKLQMLKQTFSILHWKSSWSLWKLKKKIHSWSVPCSPCGTFKPNVQCLARVKPAWQWTVQSEASVVVTLHLCPVGDPILFLWLHRLKSQTEVVALSLANPHPPVLWH